MRAGLWIFFTQNFDSAPLSFGVVGNLGADGSGHVNALTLNSAPWKGFVKSTCEVGAAANPEAGTADTRDPSVNHLIIVAAPDASVAPPAQTCTVDGNRLPCQGSDTNLDNHEVSNIAPGSTILYLMYSTVRRTIIAGIWVAFFQECQQ